MNDIDLNRLSADEKVYLGKFNTALSPDEEKAYDAWVKDQSYKLKRKLRYDEIGYDLKGFFKDNGPVELSGGHLTDKYKKPNHSTFSDQSKYHGYTDENGTKYLGGTWAVDASGNDYYKPHPSMFSNKTHDYRTMLDYFRKYEPTVKLELDAPDSMVSSVTKYQRMNTGI